MAQLFEYNVLKPILNNFIRDFLLKITHITIDTKLWERVWTDLNEHSDSASEIYD